MSDENQVELNQEELDSQERASLMDRARLLQIKVHPSIGLEKLRAKVNGVVSGDTSEEDPVKQTDEDAFVMPTIEELQAMVDSGVVETQRAKSGKFIGNRRRDANKLIRCRITCMNPNKKDWEGEVFTVSNAVVGSVKKYIPFNADDGWHIPQIILNVLQERKCQVFKTVKGPRGNKIRKGSLIKEFAVEILDPLTEQEREQLAKEQAISQRLDD